MTDASLQQQQQQQQSVTERTVL